MHHRSLCLRKFLLAIAFINSFCDECVGQTDETLKSLASGKDVVDAVSYKVKKVFGEDHRFLTRVAWVESQFGKNSQTFRKGYFGGIWQVDKTGFLDTQDLRSHANLSINHQKIKDEFGIEWRSVKWQDLTKPLYSALAARLLLLNRAKPIPTSVEEQDVYWTTYYNSDEGKGVKDKFVSDVKILESCKSSKSKCRMDLVVVLDGSGSIGYSDFKIAREFVVDLTKCISSRHTRIGLLVYSSSNTIIFSLDNNSTQTELEEKILAANYPGGGTDTASAIDAAVTMLNKDSTSGNSTLIPKIMIVLTDGQSDSPPSTARSAVRANQSGIICYATGIGSRFNKIELSTIAGSNPNQVFTIDSYSHLTDLLYQTRTQTCSKPLRPKRQTIVEDFVHQYEISYYAFNMPGNGLTLILNVTEGDALGYYSYTVENPTAALNDGVLGKGQNYIPPPRIIIPKLTNGTTGRIVRAKRTALAEEGTTRRATILNDTETQKIDEGYYGQVFIAIEGVEQMNNFTIYTIEGGDRSTAASFLGSMNILVIGFSVYVVFQAQF